MNPGQKKNLITDKLDPHAICLAKHLRYLIELARKKPEEYLSSMINNQKFAMFSRQDAVFVPTISIHMVDFEHTNNTKDLIVHICNHDQNQDSANDTSYQQLLDMHEKLSQEIDKNFQKLTDKIMACLKSVNLAAAMQVNGSKLSFQQQTDMANWLFADSYGISELYKLVAIKSILLYHHDKFADELTTNNIFLMNDSEIMGIFYLVQQQLMLSQERILYLSTFEIAQKWYDVLNNPWNHQKGNPTEYMMSLETRLIALDAMVT